MKRFPFHPARANHKPLRTATEMAEILGTSPQALGWALKSDPCAPKPQVDNSRTSAALRARWYEVQAVKQWWISRAASGAGK